MPSDDPRLKVVEQRLNALVRCVIEKAGTDPQFAARIQDVLLSDDLRTALGAKPAKKSLPAFDLVGFLAERGQGALRQELLGQPTSELAITARRHKVVSPRALKSIERSELVDKLVAHAEQKSDQGGAFSKSEGAGELPPDAPAPRGDPG